MSISDSINEVKALVKQEKFEEAMTLADKLLAQVEDIQEDEWDGILRNAIAQEVSIGNVSDWEQQSLYKNANKAWTKAGKPLDTENIRNILKTINNLVF